MITTDIDFGAWLKDVLSRAGKDEQDLSRSTGKHYSYYNRLINSGKKGKPIRPDQDIVREIGEGLVKMGIIPNAGEAEMAAQYIPTEGYIVVEKSSVEPPENFEDWPLELRQALAHAKSLPSETQKHIYRLWREQASAHADIERRREDAERKLEERERQLRELGK